MAANERVLTVAVSELGVTESPPDSNDVKYNTWYYGREVSGPEYPWCMAFVQWVFNRAGVPLPFKTASCGSLLRWYKEHAPKCVVDVKKAIPGCIVIFDLPGTKSDTDHTGIFESAGTKYVTTIDGNTGTSSDANGGAVMRRSRPLSCVKACIIPQAIAPREMCSVELPVLQQGSTGEAVRALQVLLNLRAVVGLSVDGSFGPATLRSVKLFQGNTGLTIDGSVGPATWGRLING